MPAPLPIPDNDDAGITIPLLVTATGASTLYGELARSALAVTQAATPLQQAMKFLEDRVDGAIRIPDLARVVGVSPSHLSKLFREATGGGVLAHHTALKMARARLLLDTTDLTIAEVGREIGLNDQFYFSRQFRRLDGVSPSAYRAKCLNGQAAKVSICRRLAWLPSLMQIKKGFCVASKP